MLMNLREARRRFLLLSIPDLVRDPTERFLDAGPSEEKKNPSGFGITRKGFSGFYLGKERK
jgi:hypothetical protein